MFSMIFEVSPRAGQWGTYLDNAKTLRPELEKVPGFIDNIIYKSLTREGWFLSLTGLRDERSVLSWLNLMSDHEAKDWGRGEAPPDYRLRIGQVGFDTRIPDGCRILEHRIEETEAGKASAITLIDALQWPDWVNSHNPQEIALCLGFDPFSYGDCISWDVFDAVRSPGSIVLLATWKDLASAMGFAQSAMVPDDARVRAVRGLRDYSISDDSPYDRETAGGTVRAGMRQGISNAAR